MGGFDRAVRVAAAATAMVCGPAAAQWPLPETRDGSRIEVGLGVYDMGAFGGMHDPSLLVEIAHVSGWNLGLGITTYVGLFLNSDDSAFVHTGLLWELAPIPALRVGLSSGLGYFHRGRAGKDLGHPLEFRNGLAVAYRFGSGTRLGVSFYHLSNAGIVRKNPGSENLLLTITVPTRRPSD